MVGLRWYSHRKYALRSAAEIAQAWTHQFHGTIPRSVAHFEGEILVWGFMNGILHRFAVDTGREGEMKKFAERM
jgi:hypothetical protein